MNVPDSAANITCTRNLFNDANDQSPRTQPMPELPLDLDDLPDDDQMSFDSFQPLDAIRFLFSFFTSLRLQILSRFQNLAMLLMIQISPAKLVHNCLFSQVMTTKLILCVEI